MSFKLRLKRSVTGLGLVGSLFVAGCQTSDGSWFLEDSSGRTPRSENNSAGDDTALFGAGLSGFGAYASTSNDVQRARSGIAAQKVGDGMVEYGSSKAGKDEIRQEVNVYGSTELENRVHINNQNPSSRKPLLNVVMCNYAEDTTGDGEVDKFVGQGREFYPRDGIQVYVKMPKFDGSIQVANELWINGIHAGTRSNSVPQEMSEKWMRVGYVEKGKTMQGGKYKFVLFIDDEFRGETEAEVKGWDFREVRSR